MKKARIRFWYAMVQRLVRWYYLLLFGVRVYGRERVPLEGALILACNHVSVSEPPLVGSFTPREMYFAAKRQLFGFPLGIVLRYVNAIPIRRSGSDKEAVKILSGALKEGKGILIFPEGTRTVNPEEANIKAGVGMLAMLGGADVLPVRVDGTLNHRKAFLHRGTMTITYGEVIRVSELLKDDLPRRELYHLIAERVMTHIRAL